MGTPTHKTNTGTVNGKVWTACHTGNKKILTVGETALYAGGWTRGATPKGNMIVIDLADGLRDNVSVSDETGGMFPSVEKVQNKHKVVKLYIPDYDVPKFDRAFWKDFAKDILLSMQKGYDILVACTGGHGRTGLVIAILAGLLIKPDTESMGATAYIREHYCKEAVETLEQEDYVEWVLYETSDVFVSKSYGKYSYGDYSDKYDLNDPYYTGGKQLPFETGKTATTFTDDDDETDDYLAWLAENKNKQA